MANQNLLPCQHHALRKCYVATECFKMLAWNYHLAPVLIQTRKVMPTNAKQKSRCAAKPKRDFLWASEMTSVQHDHIVAVHHLRFSAVA